MACKIPNTILETIKTDYLINLITNYPLYKDISFSNNRFLGFKNASLGLNGIPELKSRNDHIMELVKLYKSSVASDKLPNNQDQIYEYLSKTELLEFLLFESNFIKVLNPSEIIILKKIALTQFEFKKNYVEEYGFDLTITPTALILGKILTNEKGRIDNAYDESIINLLKTGKTSNIQLLYKIYDTIHFE